MRVLITILTLVTLSLQVNAQEKTRDQILFDDAFELHERKNVDSALLLFKQFMNEYPHSELRPRAHYNIGYILKEQGKTEEAKIIFKEIIESKYDDKDPGGQGIMGSQYALYKHFSCEQLADISIQEKNFIEAEKYVRLFDRKYPYEHFCGNELKAYQIYKAQTYAKVYDGQGKTDDAIDQLIPHLFFSGLADNGELINDLIPLLNKRYGENAIREELRNSMATLKLKDSRKNGETATILFYKYKIEVHDAALYRLSNPEFKANTELEGVEKYLKVVRSNGLYKNYGVE